MARRLSETGGAVVPVGVPAEEPLEIRLDGEAVATITRTPGHDFELAVGHCFAAGLLAGRSVHEVRYCATGSAVDTGFNVVTVGTSPAPPPAARTSRPDVDPGVVGRVLGDDDVIAFLAGSGEPAVARSDFHLGNAVDKVIGRLFLDGQLPASSVGLRMKGRIDGHLLERALAAGVRLVAGTVVPTSAAIALARARDAVLAFVDPDLGVHVLSPDPLSPPDR
jgi:FdhD protein